MKKVYTLLVFVLLLPFVNYSQVNTLEKDYYKWFDATVGIENTDLYNGVAYVEEFSSSRDNQRFFLSSDFRKGHVEYDGQSYYDIKMKYDVYGDQLLVNLISNSQESIIQLIKNKLKSFVIEGHLFENLQATKTAGDRIKGYHELLVVNNSCSLYKKYRKKKTKQLEKRFYYYQFSDHTSEFVLMIDQVYHTVTSKKDFVRLFPEYKKEINEFYAHSALRGFSREEQLSALANKMEQIAN